MCLLSKDNSIILVIIKHSNFEHPGSTVNRGKGCISPIKINKSIPSEPLVQLTLNQIDHFDWVFWEKWSFWINTGHYGGPLFCGRCPEGIGRNNVKMSFYIRCRLITIFGLQDGPGGPTKSWYSTKKAKFYLFKIV